MKGRKPLPIDLKILRGQRRRSRAYESVMIASSPEKPKGLDALETACWNALCRDLLTRTLNSAYPSEGNVPLTVRALTACFLSRLGRRSTLGKNLVPEMTARPQCTTHHDKE